jgi:hypothetical protein
MKATLKRILAGAALCIPAFGVTQNYVIPATVLGTSDAATGYRGVKIQTGPAVSLTAVGRYCKAGNSATHVIYVTDGAGTALGNATVNLSGCTTGTFVYAALSVSLSAGTSYFIVSAESAGGDTFYNDGGTLLNTHTQATILGSAASSTAPPTAPAGLSTNFGAPHMYGPVDFQFNAPQECYTVASGNSSSAGTWGGCGGSVPGNGQTAYIQNGHAVAWDANTTLGASVAGDLPQALVIGSIYPVGGSSTATSTTNAGVTFTSRGSIAVIGQSNYSAACTANYWAETNNGTLKWDSSVTTPTTTNYRFYTDPRAAGSRGCDTTFRSVGTQATRATITSDPGGGNGRFAMNGNNNAQGCRFTADWTNLSSLGTSSLAALILDGNADTDTSCIFRLHNSRISSSGLFLFANAASGMGIDFSGVVYGPVLGGTYQFDWSVTNATTPTGIRVLDSVSPVNPATDTMLQNSVTSCAGLTISNSIFADPACSMSTLKLAAIDSSIWLHLAQGNVQNVVIQPATWSNSYSMVYGDWDNAHWLTTGATAFSGGFWDSSSRVTAYTDNGDVIIPVSTSPMSMTTSVFAPGADPTHNAVTIPLCLDGISAAIPSVSWTHNTVFVTAPIGGAPSAGATIQEGAGHTTSGIITDYSSNLVVSTTGTNGFLWEDIQCANAGNCLLDPVSPANADYNGKYNTAATWTCAGCTNQGNGYSGKWSSTPGVHDVTANPNFVDPTRYLFPFSVAYLKQSICTAWVTATAYTAGACASIADAGYYTGSAINYIAISSHTSGAGTQPGAQQTAAGLNALTVWIPQSMYLMQAAFVNGTLITDSSIGCGAGCTYPRAAINWARSGWAPLNAAFTTAGKAGTQIGAVAAASSCGSIQGGCSIPKSSACAIISLLGCSIP